MSGLLTNVNYVSNKIFFTACKCKRHCDNPKIHETPSNEIFFTSGMCIGTLEWHILGVVTGDDSLVKPDQDLFLMKVYSEQHKTGFLEWPSNTILVSNTSYLVYLITDWKSSQD